MNRKLGYFVDIKVHREFIFTGTRVFQNKLAHVSVPEGEAVAGLVSGVNADYVYRTNISGVSLRIFPVWTVVGSEHGDVRGVTQRVFFTSHHLGAEKPSSCSSFSGNLQFAKITNTK